MLLKTKPRVTEENFARITAAERVAADAIRKDMEPHLAVLRAKGYTRLEIACAFVMLGYHALRYDRTQAQAEESFNLVYAACKERIDRGCEKPHRSLFH